MEIAIAGAHGKIAMRLEAPRAIREILYVNSGGDPIAEALEPDARPS